MSTQALSLNELPKADLRSSSGVVPRQTTGTTPADMPPRSVKGNRLKILLIALPAVAMLVTTASLWLHHAAQFESTDNAFVEADVHPVSSRIAGNVLEVLVQDNEVVHRDQILAKLDPRDLSMKLQTAQTSLEQAAAQIPQAEAVVAQAKAALLENSAEVDASAAQLEKARLDLGRAEKLRTVAGTAISAADFDSTRAAYAAAKAGHAAALAAQEAGKAGVQAAEASLAVARAGLSKSQVAVKDAELQLSYTIIRAPSAGLIGKRTLQTGQQVQPGQALLAVVSQNQWVVANFKENQLTEMRPGQAVEISIDAIKGGHFAGRIDSFAPGTGAKFSLLPPDNATGNFTKVVQRVPVKIYFDNTDEAQAGRGRIAPGLSAMAKVKVR